VSTAIPLIMFITGAAGLLCAVYLAFAAARRLHARNWKAGLLLLLAVAVLAVAAAYIISAANQRLYPVKRIAPVPASTLTHQSS
jgi:uncharacterized membrane protein YhaH (DUF805 family)